MQPRPIAETSKPWVPSRRRCIGWTLANRRHVLDGRRDRGWRDGADARRLAWADGAAGAIRGAVDGAGDRPERDRDQHESAQRQAADGGACGNAQGGEVRRPVGVTSSRPMAESFPQRSFAPPPDPTEVVLVRHGASAAAVPGEPFEMVEGHADPPLAPEGERQARMVAERLARESFAGLFVTTLQRTAQTAAPLAELTGLEPVVVPELREVGLGEWEGGELRIRAANRD